MENLNLSEILNLLAVLAVAAAVAGFMAGLLGVGGGIIMVPALYYAFTILDFDTLTRMHLSVGTSLAIIIPTSIISTKTHMEYDAVDFKMVKSFGVFILIGVILGTFLAVNLSTPPLVLFFSIFAFMVGLFFIFLREKLVENPKTISIMIKNISGVIIGFISIPLGIGGGSLMVPFMRTFGYDIRKSIGTAAAIGFLISVSGAITMIIGGKIIDNVNTPFSIGYINMLGFFVFVPVTMVMARIGAKVVYKIDRKLLSRIFGVFLIVVSIRSFIEYLNIN
ncbi:sulfite exporter TauE/SafE family protein [Pelagibacteraceae bacterium]|nr:sulfite exporter TauE/SafE family protein [Pelagibacteraceae bacterium]